MSGSKKNKCAAAATGQLREMEKSRKTDWETDRLILPSIVVQAAVHGKKWSSKAAGC